MQFYRINIMIEDVVTDEETKENKGRFKQDKDRVRGRELSQKCDQYSEKLTGRGSFFLSKNIDNEYEFGMIVCDAVDVEKFISRFIRYAKIRTENVDIKETTLRDLHRSLQKSERYGFDIDAEEVLYEYELDELIGFRRPVIAFEERLIKDCSKKDIYNSANRYFTRDTFIEELDRIFIDNSKKSKIYGHPVEYMIESDDEWTRKGMTQLLLQALYNVRRIKNRRYSEIEITSGMRFDRRFMELLYKSCSGGAVILDFAEDRNNDGEVMAGDYSFLDELCSIIQRHCCDVLSVICLPRECKNIKMMIYENMGNASFVEIKEELASDEAAIEYMKKRAGEYKVRVDKRLLSSIEMGKGYLTPELNAIFDEWYSKKLKTTVFSQYKCITGVKAEVKEKKPKGSAYEELEAMIGLNSAKEIIHQALDSYKAQKLYREKGLKLDESCNHMIFMGSPGTAKTTVARLFAQIMKENGVLSRGHIVEVGRGDLVGKYVGWTAPTIQKFFNKAEGGVLFIDEAYSLVDDRDGLYGDEAINTIVQEMENRRNKVIVIFAGYPDKMEKFLDKNPGLRSRIAHYVNFEDYNVDELCRIAVHVAEKKGLILDDAAIDRVREVMTQAKSQPDFGNGRFVRNVIEKARLAQSSRLVKMDYDLVTTDDVKRICAEDIISPIVASNKTSRKIGFING